MPHPDQNKWDARYRETSKAPHAAQVLLDNLHLLPASGQALDLACGLGGNALLLAERGLTVQAWDISAVAIDKLAQQAKGLAIETKVVDITAQALPVNQFDVIVVSYFLERKLAPAIIQALKPDGLLFYQTFNQNQLGRDPGNPDYRLQDNELLHLFRPLAFRYYREDALAGNTEQGHRDEAMLVAQKPSG